MLYFYYLQSIILFLIRSNDLQIKEDENSKRGVDVLCSFLVNNKKNNEIIFYFGKNKACCLVLKTQRKSK